MTHEPAGAAERITVRGAKPGARLELTDGGHLLMALSADAAGSAEFLTPSGNAGHSTRVLEWGSGRPLTEPMRFSAQRSRSAGFGPPEAVFAQYRPMVAVAADMDGDGASDLVVAGDGGLFLLYGRADSNQYPAIRSVPIEGRPAAAAVADLDGDGLQDIIIAMSDGQVAILRGKGNREFDQPARFSADSALSGIAIGDFNGDAIPDLALTNPYGEHLLILSGRGDSTFAPSRTYSIPGAPGSPVIGDFDGDGLTDIAVASLTGNTISILTGDGAGSFRLCQTIDAGNGPARLMVADINHDGFPDLLSWNRVNRGVSLFLNQKGHFAESQIVASEAAAISVADMDGDGREDFVTVADVGGGARIHVLSGAADSWLAEKYSAPASLSVLTVVLADLNGDSRLDAIVVDQSGTISILPGTDVPDAADAAPASSRPSLVNKVQLPISVSAAPAASTVRLSSSAASAIFGTPITFSVSILPAAATGTVTFYDGETVLGTSSVSAGTTVISTSLLSAGAHSISAYYSGDSGTAAASSPVLTQQVNAVAQTGLRAAAVYGMDRSPTSIVLADFDGDGKVDLATANWVRGNVTAMLANGDGSFRPAAGANTGMAPLSLATGDFNRDGKPDLVTANFNSADISVLFGNGDGTFRAAVNYPAGGNGPVCVVTGDFNGDGIVDLAVSLSFSGSVGILLGKADGTFAAAVAWPVGTGPQTIAVGDFNGDGKTDIVSANFFGGNLGVILGRGDGTFGPPSNFAAGMDSFGVAVADFNRDGKADLVTATCFGGTTNILLGKGDGTFQGAVSYSGDKSAFAVTAADMDGDGKVDVVVTDLAGDVALYLGKGDGSLTSAAVYPTMAAYSRQLMVGEFNGDGRTDVAVANSDGTVSVLIGMGSPSVAQTITFAPLDLSESTVPGDVSPAPLSATASSGLPVHLASVNADACSVSDSTVTILGNGTCSVIASQAGNGTYAPATPVIRSFAVDGASQTITFGPLADTTTGIPSLTLVASASSGLAVIFKSSTPLVCTVTGNTVSILTPGLCAITATQPGNAEWFAAPPVMRSFQVTGVQTILFSAVADVALGTAPFLLNATATSGLAVTFSSTTLSVCTVAGSTVTVLAAGTCTIKADQSGNTSWLAAPAVSQSFVVRKPQTISIGALGGATLGAAPIVLTATATSGLAVSFASNTLTVCTVSGTTVTLIAVGTCTVTASQPGNAVWAAAAPVVQSFSVSAAPSGGGNSGGGGSSGGGGGSAGGGSALSASPAEVAITANAKGSAATATVTLTYQTYTGGTITYASAATTNQGAGWLSLSPATGTLTQVSYAGFLYTYQATVTVNVDPSSLSAGNTYSGTVNFQAGNGIASASVKATIQEPPPASNGAQLSGVINAAGGSQAALQVITPGSYVAVYGSGLGDSGQPLATTLPLPTTLNGVRLLLGGKPMPLLYASPGQINAIVPQDLTPNTSYPLVVMKGKIASPPTSIRIAAAQPGIYTVNASGSGQGIVEIAGTTLLAAPDGAGARPVRKGSEYLVVFCTGLGSVRGPNGEPGPADGAAAPSDRVFQTIQSISATIGGVDAPVVFSGLTPSLAALYQVNILVPEGVPAGSAVPLVLTATDPVTKNAVKSNTVSIAVE